MAVDVDIGFEEPEVYEIEIPKALRKCRAEECSNRMGYPDGYCDECHELAVLRSVRERAQLWISHYQEKSRQLARKSIEIQKAKRRYVRWW